jgi:hypothetical protein
MEGWRQRRLDSKTRNSQGGRRKTNLTLTGLLMEGLELLAATFPNRCASNEAHVPSGEVNCPVKGTRDFARLFYTFSQWRCICDYTDHLSDFHFSLLESLSVLWRNSKILPMHSALTLLVQ